MGLDGFPYLIATENILVHTAHHIAETERQAIQEMYRLGQSVNTLHFEVVGIFLQTSTLFLEVEAFADQANSLACAVSSLDIKAQSCLWITFTNHDFIQIDITICGSRTYLMYAAHFNLLDQFLVVSIDGIKSKYKVIYLTVCSTIKQGEERVEKFDALSGRIAFVRTQHTLRFVYNQDGARLGQDVNRLSRTELVTTREDDTGCDITGTTFFVLIFVERDIKSLRVDYHGMDTIVRGKGINLGKLPRVVDEVLHAFAVLFGKMFRHTLKTLIHAFADGNVGHYDHKFRPTIAGVQLVHGFDVSISLTRTCFHLDGKGASVTFQMLHGSQSFCHLYTTHILANAFIVKHKGQVAEAVEVERTQLIQEGAAAVVFGLPLKHVAHTFSSFRLKALMFISDLHGCLRYQSEGADSRLPLQVKSLYNPVCFPIGFGLLLPHYRRLSLLFSVG